MIIQTKQPGLLSSIIDIVLATTAADDQPCSDLLQSCKTLDDLQSELITMGYCLSHSVTYLHLLPCNYTTAEGKWHVTTVPVKLCKAANSLHKDHVDAHFAASCINYLKDLAVMFDPECTFSSVRTIQQ